MEPGVIHGPVRFALKPERIAAFLREARRARAVPFDRRRRRPV